MRSAIPFAISIYGEGWHPALRSDQIVEAQQRYWNCSTPSEDLDGTRSLVWIKSPTLSDAQTLARRLRSTITKDADTKQEITIMLVIEAAIAESASAARSRLAELDSQLREPHPAQTYRYVGTPSGLTGLVEDIHRAQVADGAVVIPLENKSTGHLIVTQVAPAIAGAVDPNT